MTCSDARCWVFYPAPSGGGLGCLQNKLDRRPEERGTPVQQKGWICRSGFDEFDDIVILFDCGGVMCMGLSP